MHAKYLSGQIPRLLINSNYDIYVKQLSILYCCILYFHNKNGIIRALNILILCNSVINNSLISKIKHSIKQMLKYLESIFKISH